MGIAESVNLQRGTAGKLPKRSGSGRDCFRPYLIPDLIFSRSGDMPGSIATAGRRFPRRCNCFMRIILQAYERKSAPSRACLNMILMHHKRESRPFGTERTGSKTTFFESASRPFVPVSLRLRSRNRQVKKRAAQTIRRNYVFSSDRQLHRR